MCGIFGYFDRTGRPLDENRLVAMGRSIAHRGPDDHGVYHAHGVAVGNQRLSIIDLASGHQPFASDDQQIQVVQNGEIFNYIELMDELRADGIHCRTHCDTEVILRLYERHGIEFVHKLNGMFAIAIYDHRERALYLIRDRIGEKPFYIHDSGTRLLFASEIKALLVAGAPRELDLHALDQFLTFNFIPPPDTIFRDIHHLPPGHWMRITPHATETRCWWDVAMQQPMDRGEGDWIEEFITTLDDATRIRLRADVPFGAFLSGGVDSSTIVGLMARHLREPVKTFCIGFHESRYDESPFAAEAALRFGTDHTIERADANMLDRWPRVLWHCDQPHGDVSFMPTMRVSELAVQHVKMVLTGDGGDELFAGYDKYRNIFANPNVLSARQSQFENSYCRNISLFAPESREALYSPEVRRQLTRDPYDTVLELFNSVPHQDRINQALYVDMRHLLPGNNLVKPDRMSMAVSLETRAPFLDFRMMELAFRIPGQWKLRDGETKYIYKKAVSPLIGQNLAFRPKQMFTVPIGEWFKTSLAPWCRELLFSPRTLNRDLFRKQTVEHIFNSHLSGTANFTREIRALLAVELWHREFIDQFSIGGQRSVDAMAIPRAA